MDIEGRGWNFDKLIQIFNPAYAEEIAKIKIPPRSSNDFVAWHVEKIGLFSIRSAYNLALKIRMTPQSQATSSAPGGERKLWAHVWSGRVPPKVSVFIWKLARDIQTRRAKFISLVTFPNAESTVTRSYETSGRYQRTL